MEKSTIASIQVVSGFGQRLEELDTEFVKGYNEIRLEMSQYQNGLYFIRTVLDNKIQSLPIIIQK